MKSKVVITLICLMGAWIIDAAVTNAQRVRKPAPPKPAPKAKPRTYTPPPKANKEASLDALFDKFALIPAGEFVMGSKNEEDSASPVHKVRISRSFEMGKYEVTQAQWKAVMENNPSEYKGANRPVEKVSWEDVQKFIQVLNSKSPKYYYRLPTEAEWEYACRAGSTGDYAGDLESMAWFGNNSGKKRIDADEIFSTNRTTYLYSVLDNSNQTHPVGQKQPNAWGLYDMHGNVWEWCHDLYGNYSESYQVDPEVPASGSERVERGGSFSDRAAHCRSTFRATDSPRYRGPDLGFRLVRTPQ